MDGDVELAAVAGLLADPGRARMCMALMSGRRHPASELAQIAQVAPSTASGHLAKLLDGGLVKVEQRGRHRYYRLASAEVAGALEALSRLAPRTEVKSLRQARVARDLRLARTCYDHFAGRLGISLTDRLAEIGVLQGDNLELGPAGERCLADLRIGVAELRAARRPLTRGCLDWTERRDHLAGSVGAALARRLFELKWVTRTSTRAVRVTDAGTAGLGYWIELHWPPVDLAA